jgi:hypothetical protein
VQAQADRKVVLVVQVSGGALARTSSVNPSIKIKSNFRGNRVDTIFRAGLRALLFFCFSQGFAPCSFLFFAELRALLFFSTRIYLVAQRGLRLASGFRDAARCQHFICGDK